MRKPVVVGVAALVVLGAGFGAFLVKRNNDDKVASPTTSTTSFDDTSTTTTTVAATSSTRPPRSTTTTSARATSSTTARSSGTTTTGVVAACGTGTATARFTAKDLVTDALSQTFTPQVTVDNQVNAPIEVDEISIEITYMNSNEVRAVHFTTAGAVIGAGTSASFTSDKLTSAQRYATVKFTMFAYFISGQKANCRVTTP